MDNEKIRRLIKELADHIQEAGARTFLLLDELEPTSEAHRIINELDSQLSIMEDTAGDLEKHLS